MKKSNLIRTIILAGSLLFQLSILSFQSRAAVGDVDLSFDPGSGANNIVKCVAVQPDGKVIVGGQFTTINGLLRTNLARLNANGSGDATFNPAIDYNEYSLVSSLALQPDGKVLVASELPETIYDEFGSYSFTEFHFTRLNTNGSLDAGFNSVVGIGSYPAYGSSVALHSGGKVIIGGDFDIVNGTDRRGIARLNTNGTLDPNFNPRLGGYYAGVYSIALQTDSKVLIGGSFTSVTGTNRNYIARLNADGSLDGSFNPGTGANSWVNSVAVESDGKVLIGGYFSTVAGTNRSGIASLNANGSLDNSFNASTGTNSYVFSVALQSDGKIILGGSFSTLNGTNHNGIARLTANGSLDGSFDTGIGVTGGNSWPGYVSRVYSLALQEDGKVFIGGDFTGVNGVSRAYVARLYGDAVVPSLNIARSNSTVIVSWPVTALNFQLQESTDLSLPNGWSLIAQPAVTNAGQISVTVPATAGRKFFRLKSH